MRYVILLMSLCVLALCGPSHAAAAPATRPAIVESGGVAVTSIRVFKYASADGDPDVSKTQVGLWLTRKAEGDTPSHVLRITQLDPVVDDTGKVLSSAARLNAMPFMTRDVKTNRERSVGGRSGPTLELTLDPPGRGATKIKSIKGRATMSSLVFTRLKYDDLRSFSESPLTHPKLVGFPITASVRVQDAQTLLSLVVPADHARITDWGLGSKDRLLGPTSKLVAPVGGTNTVSLKKTYAGDRLNDAFLGIMLADPADTVEYAFSFQDLELP